MKLIPISEHPRAVFILYELLEERPASACISHKQMPTFEEHCAFVNFNSQPDNVRRDADGEAEISAYRDWCLVQGQDLVDDQGNVIDPGAILGSVYLTRANEIGIAIFKRYLDAPIGNGAGRNAVKLLMEKHGKRRYLANVAPTNEPSRKMFEKLGFKVIQQTLTLEAE